MPATPTDERATPEEFVKMLEYHFGFKFTLDPCATAENAKASIFFTAEDDGLTKSWNGHRVFMNPPFSKGNLKKWTKKAANEAHDHPGIVIVGLLPADSSTHWWHDFVFPYANHIIFLRGRLKFGENDTGAKFPSALAVWGDLPIHMPPFYCLPAKL